ncbi:MAG TPA: hypothetical protein VJV23_14715 [Candidatus Polarisedimenticolia bacterium]|nr:hypothetical protein [Candidatus Polarisedimenticolia bacterium]
MTAGRAAPRLAAALALGCAATAVLGCAVWSGPPLGVDDEEARRSLRSARIAFARRDGVYLARGDGSQARRLAGAGREATGSVAFVAAMTTAQDAVLHLTLDELDVRDGTGIDPALNILELSGGGVAGRRRIRLAPLLPPGADGRIRPSRLPGAAWSPDGASIALAARGEQEGADRILLFDRKGRPSGLFELEGIRLAPASGLAWDQEGDGLLLSAEGGEGQEGDRIVRLCLEPGARRGWISPLAPGRDPAPSPAGARLAVVRDAPGGPSDIVLLDGAGKEVERFQRPAGRALHHLFWSADGRYLYYHSLASTGPLGLIEVGMLRCLDTRTRKVFDLLRLG